MGELRSRHQRQKLIKFKARQIIVDHEKRRIPANENYRQALAVYLEAHQRQKRIYNWLWICDWILPGRKSISEL